MTALAPGSLFAHLGRLPDPRSPHGRRFSLSSWLACACVAVPCGQSSYAAIAPWARNPPAEFLHTLGFFRRLPAAIGLLRLSGVNNIAEALRENLYRVAELLANLGILNL